MPTKDAKEYKASIAILCRQAGISKPLDGRVLFDVKLYPNRPQDWQKRMRIHGDAWSDTVQCIDLDNANKVILDALKGIAIIDDKWVWRITAERMEPDDQGARVVVTITPLLIDKPQTLLPLNAPDMAAGLAVYRGTSQEAF